MSVTGSAAITIQTGRWRVGPGQPPHLVAERLGVGEKQRAVESVNHQAGQMLGLRMGVGVVVARQPFHPPELGVVGPPCPPEDVEDRQADRDRDPRQHAEQDDAKEGGDRQREFGLALPPQPRRGGDVGQG
jgi:hypothetical protein